MIRTRTASGEGIEDVRRELASKQDVILRKQYRQVPFYLQHVFGLVTERYVPNNIGTMFDWMVNVVHESGYEVCYLSLNYDLYLENALH